MSRILIVEDERALRRALTINLTARHYDVEAVADGASALRSVAATPPDVVLLDLGLPDMDGLDVIEGLRGWTNVAIIVLSARDAQLTKVDALDLGADDYMTKPFGMDELLARIRVALRRPKPDEQAEPVVATEAFTLDLRAKRAEHRGDPVHLTPTEWRLAEALVRRPGVLVPGTQLLHEVWGPAYERETNYLRVYVAQLRRKLEDDPAAPAHFITEAGLGYRFEP